MFNMVLEGLSGQVHNRIRQMTGAGANPMTGTLAPTPTQTPAPSLAEIKRDETTTANEAIRLPAVTPSVAERERAELANKKSNGLLSSVTATAATVGAATASQQAGFESNIKGLS
jgi:hypothetical protein